LEIKKIGIEPGEDVNIILGQSHFIKTVEDIYEAIVNTVPQARFGIAFAEASGDCLVRHEGNDEELEELASETMLEIAAGHAFIVFLRNAFPINVLQRIKDVPEVVNIYCATANPVEVIIAETEQGRGIIGVVDGQSPGGIEGEEDKAERKEFLRVIGYKF